MILVTSSFPFQKYFCPLKATIAGQLLGRFDFIFNFLIVLNGVRSEKKNTISKNPQMYERLRSPVCNESIILFPKKLGVIAAVLSGLPILEIGHQVPHLIRICTKKELSKNFFRFIRNVSRPLNSLVHACLI